MSMRTILGAAALSLLAAPVLAGGWQTGGYAPAGHQAALYPYHASANYCPAGLQPIVVNGVICCGQPNQHISYSAMMQHPQTHRVHRTQPTFFDSPGIKGNGN